MSDAVDDLLRPLAARLDAMPAEEREAILAHGDSLLRQRRAARRVEANLVSRCPDPAHCDADCECRYE